MGNRVGRPGQDRAKDGRVRCAIPPELKRRAEDLAHGDGRLRSLSQLIEAAIAFYIQQYQEASGVLDKHNHPDLKRGSPPHQDLTIRPPIPMAKTRP